MELGIESDFVANLRHLRATVQTYIELSIDCSCISQDVGCF